MITELSAALAGMQPTAAPEWNAVFEPQGQITAAVQSDWGAASPGDSLLAKLTPTSFEVDSRGQIADCAAIMTITSALGAISQTDRL